MAIKILIVDDHGVLRAGLRALLSREGDIEVVGEAADGETAVRQALKFKPNIVLMDITLPGINGLQAAKEIVTRMPGVRVLMLTVHTDHELVREALSYGVAGYVLKQAVESELINAIHAVARGDLYIDPAMTRALLQAPQQAPSPSPFIETLTPRETEVLELIARGYTNRQIAEKLCLSVRTIESHRANILEKLHLESRVELVRYARKHGLME